MTTDDMTPGPDPQLTAAVEEAFAGVTPDPAQVGISDLDTALHFRDLADKFLRMRKAEPLLAADIEDLFTPEDHDDLTSAAEIVTSRGQWSADALTFTHPELYDAIENHFEAIDPLTYLGDIIAAESPEAAQAAYEQLVTGEWDGDL